MLVIGILLFIVAVIAIAFMIQTYRARRYAMGKGWVGYSDFLCNTLSGLSWSHFKFIMFNNHKQMAADLGDPRMTSYLDEMIKQLDEYIVELKPMQYQILFQLKQLGYDAPTVRRIICGFFLQGLEASEDLKELKRYTVELKEDTPSINTDNFNPNVYGKEVETLCKEYFQKTVIDNLEKYDIFALYLSYTRFKYDDAFEKHIAK